MMIDRIHFGIVGGDQRQTALADSIAGDGFTVYACGFDNAVFDAMYCCCRCLSR